MVENPGWLVQRLDVERAVLDFSSSGQGPRTVTQLVADGVVVANATELTSWSGPSSQVEVCDSCGYEGCAPGGWVSVRQAGDVVVWIPAFGELARGDRDGDELAPPAYLKQRGLPCFAGDVAVALERAVGSRRPFPPLTRRELALAFQWVAPAGILGAFPEQPAIRRSAVLAVSSGDRAAVLDRLDALLAGAWADDAPVQLERLSSAEPVELYLDMPMHPGWSPLAIVDRRAALCVGDRVASSTAEPIGPRRRAR